MKRAINWAKPTGLSQRLRVLTEEYGPLEYIRCHSEDNTCQKMLHTCISTLE